MVENRHSSERTAIGRAQDASRSLAAALPRLVSTARRIAATVVHGLHGRARAGRGENFWQYRRFVSGEPAQRVDWRRSGRDDQLYVREQEWEAAHTIWIWPDRSASMDFVSDHNGCSKLERGLVVTFALAELLVTAGERVGIPGLLPPTASRAVIDKMAQAMLHDLDDRVSLPPPAFSPAPGSAVVVIGDLWSPIPAIETMLSGLSRRGAGGTLVQIVDPAEETFPYSGHIEFIEPEGAGIVTARRAESWVDDYAARLALHRARIREASSRLGFLFTSHSTARPASELLLFLHAALTQPQASPIRYGSA